MIFCDRMGSVNFCDFASPVSFAVVEMAGGSRISEFVFV